MHNNNNSMEYNVSQFVSQEIVDRFRENLSTPSTDKIEFYERTDVTVMIFKFYTFDTDFYSDYQRILYTTITEVGINNSNNQSKVLNSNSNNRNNSNINFPLFNIFIGHGNILTGSVGGFFQETWNPILGGTTLVNINNMIKFYDRLYGLENFPLFKNTVNSNCSKSKNSKKKFHNHLNGDNNNNNSREEEEEDEDEPFKIIIHPETWELIRDISSVEKVYFNGKNIDTNYHNNSNDNLNDYQEFLNNTSSENIVLQQMVDISAPVNIKNQPLSSSIIYNNEMINNLIWWYFVPKYVRTYVSLMIQNQPNNNNTTNSSTNTTTTNSNTNSFIPQQPKKLTSTTSSSTTSGTAGNAGGGYDCWSIETRPLAVVIIHFFHLEYNHYQFPQFQKLIYKIQALLHTPHGKIINVIQRQQGVFIVCAIGLPPDNQSNQSIKCIKFAKDVFNLIHEESSSFLRDANIMVLSEQVISGIVGCKQRSDFIVMSEKLNHSINWLASIYHRSEFPGLDDVGKPTEGGLFLCDEEIQADCEGLVVFDNCSFFIQYLSPIFDSQTISPTVNPTGEISISIPKYIDKVFYLLFIQPQAVINYISDFDRIASNQCSNTIEKQRRSIISRQIKQITLFTPHSPAALKPTPNVPLFGRDNEMMFLYDRFNGLISNNESSFTLIRGLKGMGKSKILQEFFLGKDKLIKELKNQSSGDRKFHEVLDSVKVLNGTCSPLDTDIPYAAFSNIFLDLFFQKGVAGVSGTGDQYDHIKSYDLRDLIHHMKLKVGSTILKQQIEEHYQFLIPVFRMRKSINKYPEQTNDNLHLTVQLLLNILADAVKHHPIVITLDDIQDIDEYSLAFLNYLSKKLTPIMIIATTDVIDDLQLHEVILGIKQTSINNHINVENGNGGGEITVSAVAAENQCISKSNYYYDMFLVNLEPNCIEEMVKSVLGVGIVSRYLLEYIVNRAGGVPLVVVELIRHLKLNDFIDVSYGKSQFQPSFFMKSILSLPKSLERYFHPVVNLIIQMQLVQLLKTCCIFRGSWFSMSMIQAIFPINDFKDTVPENIKRLVQCNILKRVHKNDLSSSDIYIENLGTSSIGGSVIENGGNNHINVPLSNGRNGGIKSIYSSSTIPTTTNLFKNDFERISTTTTKYDINDPASYPEIFNNNFDKSKRNQQCLSEDEDSAAAAAAIDLNHQNNNANNINGGGGNNISNDTDNPNSSLTTLYTNGSYGSGVYDTTATATTTHSTATTVTTTTHHHNPSPINQDESNYYYNFNRILLSDIIYSRLIQIQRITLHRLLVEHLEKYYSPLAASGTRIPHLNKEIALHWSNADLLDHDGGNVKHFCTMAAEESMRECNFINAIKFSYLYIDIFRKMKYRLMGRVASELNEKLIFRKKVNDSYYAHERANYSIDDFQMTELETLEYAKAFKKIALAYMAMGYLSNAESFFFSSLSIMGVETPKAENTSLWQPLLKKFNRPSYHSQKEFRAVDPSEEKSLTLKETKTVEVSAIYASMAELYFKAADIKQGSLFSHESVKLLESISSLPQTSIFPRLALHYSQYALYLSMDGQSSESYATVSKRMIDQLSPSYFSTGNFDAANTLIYSLSVLVLRNLYLSEWDKVEDLVEKCISYINDPQTADKMFQKEKEFVLFVIVVYKLLKGDLSAINMINSYLISTRKSGWYSNLSIPLMGALFNIYCNNFQEARAQLKEAESVRPLSEGLEFIFQQSISACIYFQCGDHSNAISEISRVMSIIDNKSGYGFRFIIGLNLIIHTLIKMFEFLKDYSHNNNNGSTSDILTIHSISNDLGDLVVQNYNPNSSFQPYDLDDNDDIIDLDNNTVNSFSKKKNKKNNNGGSNSNSGNGSKNTSKPKNNQVDSSINLEIIKTTSSIPFKINTIKDCINKLLSKLEELAKKEPLSTASFKRLTGLYWMALGEKKPDKCLDKLYEAAKEGKLKKIPLEEAFAWHEIARFEQSESKKSEASLNAKKLYQQLNIRPWLCINNGQL
eukprot:gene3683-4588_t